MKRISIELEKAIINDYKNHIGTIAISKKYNISRTTVQKYLIKNNITFNKHPVTSRIFNHNFFSTYNPESCYWAGFILADGYVRANRNSLEILLSNIDDEHLLNFTMLLGLKEDIRRYYKNACGITICSDTIKQALCENFDIVNKKSLICFISNKIPKQFLHHYIRGYFDGDGCFSNEKRFSFVGTLATCQFIGEFFKENGITKTNGEIPTICQKKDKNILYSIKYSKSQSEKIFKLLFKDSTEHTRLKRKYEKIFSYLHSIH